MLDDDPLMTSVMVDAAPHQVFPFFTDPTRLSRWLGNAADTDPVVGGGFAVDINDRLIRGAYLEVEPPRRLVFTWGDVGSAELPPGSSRVEVDLEQVGNLTRVTLRHFGLTGAIRADHARGWPFKLDDLALAARSER